MKIKFNKKIIIFIIILIVVCILISIFSYNAEKNKDMEDNYIEVETVAEEKDNELGEETSYEHNEVLQKDNNTDTYFILKQCMELYYNSKKIKSNFRIIDGEAIKSLGITEDNALNLVGNIDTPKFSIDEIYRQNINKEKKIYVIYYRLETGENTYNQRSIIIKIDEKNNLFSIYPYEFLQKNNLNNLKQNDTVNINKSIENNAVNYYTKYTVSDSDITKELYEKLQFNLQRDLERAYNLLDKTYKEARFLDYNDFKQFVQERYEKIRNDNLEKYKFDTYNKYMEYIAICKNNSYVFIVNNMMDYSCLLDTYTIGTLELISIYNASLPEVKAEYCIDRIIAAINDKNYQFVYEKTDILQRQKIGDLEDFKKYIQGIFYDNTTYEVNDFNVIGEDICYEYEVLLDKKDENSDLKRIIKIKIILQDGLNFIMNIDEK